MPRHFPDSKPNLMIVDDDPDQLALFRMTADRSKIYWRIATANHGQDAYDEILGSAEGVPRFVPQIVLTDIKMPTMGGIELARALQSDPRVPPVRIVAMSNSDYPPEVEGALGAGCCAFLQKPGDFQKLKELFASLPAICGIDVGIPSQEDVMHTGIIRNVLRVSFPQGGLPSPSAG